MVTHVVVHVNCFSSICARTNEENNAKMHGIMKHLGDTMAKWQSGLVLKDGI